jgi:hypothetical protein
MVYDKLGLAVDSPLSFPLLFDLKEKLDFYLLFSNTIYIYDGLCYAALRLSN